jgi:hypothetical protein
MHELEEPEIQRQFVLRDATVRAQPGAQQRPEAFDRIDMYLAEPVAVLVAGLFAAGVADSPVRIAPGGQARIDVVFIGVDQRAGHDRCSNDRLDRGLLHIGQQAQHDLSAALDQPEDRWLVLFQRAASRRTLKPALPSRAPLFSTSADWPLCPATM